VGENEQLIQIAERQLAEAEEAYRRDPSASNQRLIMKRWEAVRRARGEDATPPPNPPWLTPHRPSDR
jgi:hypothetical protein